MNQNFFVSIYGNTDVIPHSLNATAMSVTNILLLRVVQRKQKWRMKMEWETCNAIYQAVFFRDKANFALAIVPEQQKVKLPSGHKQSAMHSLTLSLSESECIRTMRNLIRNNNANLFHRT